MISGKISNVPFDAVTKTTEISEEITIPPRQLSKPLDLRECISVKSLDVIGRTIFKDIKSFNYIQSQVFQVAYNTNENMLICAPTGAGKTNIALLTIGHQINQHMHKNVLQLDKFKVRIDLLEFIKVNKIIHL